MGTAMAGRERSCFGGLKLSIIEHGVPSILDKLDANHLLYRGWCPGWSHPS